MINYYVLLEIEKDSSEDAILNAIKAKRRLWNQRTTNIDDNIRREAEDTVSKIADAERILLNKAERDKYDRELLNQEAQQGNAQESSSCDKNWNEITRYYMDQGNYNSASYAANEAVRQSPNDPSAWLRKAICSMKFGNNDDAEFELNEAVRLCPDNLELLDQLGEFYYKMNRNQEALSIFVKIKSKDNNFYSDEQYKLKRIQCLWGMNNYKVACPIITEIYNSHGGAPDISNMYAAFLIDMILNAWSKTYSGGLVITNWNQYNFTKQWQQVLNTVPVFEQDLANRIAQTNQIITSFEQRSFVEGGLSDAADSFFSGGLITGTIGALTSLGITASRGHKMQWEWIAESLSVEELLTGMQ